MLQVTDFQLCRKTVLALKDFVFEKFFLGLPFTSFRSGCFAARRSARPCVFFRCAQKNWVWPAATAVHPSAAHPFFFFGLFSSAVLLLFFLDQWVKTHSKKESHSTSKKMSRWF
ncbi:hypothetical protein PPO43_13720 [Saprospira sp. CCB-QB6]|uniref:hypothetical protein n=1 Tax=Saprospira sp. CCB-QB6 TaxID=3023936 RepID=UPI00234A72BF|nr:hypothetical protein [Saprospira sp. CCB-QB6]WCL81027.1 hypothetical protein PPO43_13720 [Saprospira sp. CCB-QB6]